MSTAVSDSRWMDRALELAACGLGSVEPNPLVGCVLVGGEPQAGLLLGEGYHARFGEEHAERAAIADAQRRGHADQLAGATAYVTLEPCCHHGKTPPCTTALVEVGIARVVAASLDPFPKVSGQGVAALQAAGIEVVVGVGQAAAEQLNAPYLKRIRQGRPWVIAKWAMSLDGKLATHVGDSQWISGNESRGYVQELRGRVDAVLVGRRTALMDNPRLTARTPCPPPRTALRVVVDSNLQLPLESQLVTTARQTPVLLCSGPTADQHQAQQLRQLGCHVIQFEQPDRSQRLDDLLAYLVREFSVTNLLVEGGGELLGSLLQLKQIDQCEVFIAPKLIGGRAAPTPIAGLGLAHLSQCPDSYALQVRSRGDDTHVSVRLRWD